MPIKDPIKLIFANIPFSKDIASFQSFGILYICAKLKMKNIIEAAWENRSLLEEKQTQDSIRSIITQLMRAT